MGNTGKYLRLFLLGALVPAAAGCGDLFQVESPGNIADGDLNTPDAIPGIVTGMSYDLAQAMDGTLQFTSLAAVELWHGGSYDWGAIPRGIILDEDVNGEWATMHQARWVAEQGIVRIRDEILLDDPDRFESSAYVARAYLLGGFANRWLGENLCETVIDGGPAISHTEHFVRADSMFSRAIEIGERAGNGANDIVQAAYAGRASVRAWQGDWSGAVDDASMVPASMVYYAYLQVPSPDNDLVYETYDRPEYTVWGTEFEDHPGDPRAPWEIRYEGDGSVARGADGATPFYQQTKYTTRDDDIPLVKGTEMLVLRAEAALRDDDVPGAVALMNQARAEYGMTPLDPEPTTLAEAWPVLQYERGATIWLEGRRFWDLRRWYDEAGPAHNDFLADRARCMPISEEEKLSNPNLGG